MNRRGFLKLAAGSALSLGLGGCSDKLRNLFGPGDEKLWGMNVHPYGGDLDDLQLLALRELGIDRIRITLGLGRDLARRYLRSHPAEYVGLVNDYELGGVNPSTWPGLVRQALDQASGVPFLEILNEPGSFLGVGAAAYVNDYLRPAYEIIKGRNPDVKVIAAAPQGTQNGVLYFGDMTRAGADEWCDYRGVHLYQENAEQYLFLTDRPFMVTETGKSDRARHLDWWKNAMPRMSGVLETDRLYWYVLLDRPDGGHSLISENPGPDGGVVPVSPLYDYIRETW